jgi:hypothetical protein
LRDQVGIGEIESTNQTPYKKLELIIMAKQTKKTKKNQENTVQVENLPSDAAEPLLTNETTKPVNVPQTATGEELQKQEPPQESPKSQLSQEPPEEPLKETLELEPEQEAELRKNQCPRCKHKNSKRGFIFPGVRTVVAPVFYEGVQYQVVKIRTTKCEKCGQKFCLREYLPKIKK